MVPWWKRLVYSLASVIVSVVVCLAVIFARMFVRGLSGHPYSRDFLISLIVLLVCCIPGWLIAWPFVLLAKNLRGWRLPVLWLGGSCIGPVLLLGFGALVFHGLAGFWNAVPEVTDFLFLTAALSCLSATLYLLLLRRAQARSPQSASQTAATAHP